MQSRGSEENPALPDRRGWTRRALMLIAVAAVVIGWPLARRVASQPQVDPAVRAQCRTWMQEYRASLLSYWSTADSDDRVNLIL